MATMTAKTAKSKAAKRPTVAEIEAGIARIKAGHRADCIRNALPDLFRIRMMVRRLNQVPLKQTMQPLAAAVEAVYAEVSREVGTPDRR